MTQSNSTKTLGPMLRPDLPMVNDPEGAYVPTGLPAVIDAHVHVFPDNLLSAVWQWFATHAHRVRYQLQTAQIFDFLLSRGVSHIIALQYAHKPGMATMLNHYLAGQCAAFPGKVSGMATVFPGEDKAGQILKNAFDLGLRGVKLHAHVQCFDMDAPEMDEIYNTCSTEQKPLVIHAGKEPKSLAYRCDPYLLCSIEKVKHVLKNFPNLKICVPHLGLGETDKYRKLIEAYDTLWLDTAMVMADYLPTTHTLDLRHYRLDRVMYGTDFPNLPCAWDRQLKKIAALNLKQDDLEWVLNKSAVEFFDIPM